MESSLKVLKDTSIMKTPPCEDWMWWKALNLVDAFSSLKAVIDPLIQLSKATFAIKAGAQDSSDMHKRVKTLVSATTKLKEIKLFVLV